MDDELTYLTEGEFAFVSYVPSSLKVGMHFLHQVTVGLIEPEWIFFTLEEVPEDEDMFMSLYGAPVLVYVVSTEDGTEVLANPKEIRLFDDGGELVPISDAIMTEIINKDEGFMDIECDDTGDVILFEGSVIISYISSIDGEEEDE